MVGRRRDSRVESSGVEQKEQLPAAVFASDGGIVVIDDCCAVLVIRHHPTLSASVLAR